MCLFEVTHCKETVKDVPYAYYYVDDEAHEVVYKCHMGYHFDDVYNTDGYHYFYEIVGGDFPEEDEDEYAEYYDHRYRYLRAPCLCEPVEHTPKCVRELQNRNTFSYRNI